MDRTPSLRTTSDERFHPGDIAPASGEYEVVDARGNPTDYDLVSLDEGELFPKLKDSQLCYMLHVSEEDTLPLTPAESGASLASS
jgi:hypothetical protein